jgi:hypothetical protein
MKKIYTTFILLSAIVGGLSNTSAQNSCFNADFSNSNFTNWTGSTSDGAGIVAGVPNSLPSSTGQQTIMNVPGTDPNTGNALIVLPSGGTSSCRLGNDLCNPCSNSEPTMASLSYAIPVTTSNCVFTYQYAVVLQDTTASNAPKFSVYVLDALGNVVDPVCGVYEITSSSNLSGFTKCLPVSSVCSPLDSVVWKDWTPVSIDLSPYIGQTITIEFITNDCGPLFGYAYISCSCGLLQIEQTCSGTSDILTAPDGFASYSWSPTTGLSSTTDQQVTITNSSIYTGDLYTCTCTSVTGCQVIINTTVISCPSAISEIETQDNIVIFPNPSMNIITIETSKQCTIEISNIEGQIIKTSSIANTTTSVDLTDLSSGVYIVRAKTDKEVTTKKIIKE